MLLVSCQCNKLLIFFFINFSLSLPWLSFLVFSLYSLSPLIYDSISPSLSSSLLSLFILSSPPLRCRSASLSLGSQSLLSSLCFCVCSMGLVVVRSLHGLGWNKLRGIFYLTHHGELKKNPTQPNSYGPG